MPRISVESSSKTATASVSECNHQLIFPAMNLYDWINKLHDWQVESVKNLFDGLREIIASGFSKVSEAKGIEDVMTPILALILFGDTTTGNVDENYDVFHKYISKMRDVPETVVLRLLEEIGAPVSSLISKYMSIGPLGSFEWETDSLMFDSNSTKEGCSHMYAPVGADVNFDLFVYDIPSFHDTIPGVEMWHPIVDKNQGVSIAGMLVNTIVKNLFKNASGSMYLVVCNALAGGRLGAIEPNSTNYSPVLNKRLSQIQDELEKDERDCIRSKVSECLSEVCYYLIDRAHQLLKENGKRPSKQREGQSVIDLLMDAMKELDKIKPYSGYPYRFIQQCLDCCNVMFPNTSFGVPYQEVFTVNRQGEAVEDLMPYKIFPSFTEEELSNENRNLVYARDYIEILYGKPIKEVISDILKEEYGIEPPYDLFNFVGVVTLKILWQPRFEMKQGITIKEELDLTIKIKHIDA
nr:MAG TPA: hypothetical protein [Caudoviricetes sp.]